MQTRTLASSTIPRSRTRLDYATTVALLLMTIIFASALAISFTHPLGVDDVSMIMTGP